MLIIVFGVIVSTVLGLEDPVVTVSEGKLKGYLRTTKENRTFYSFEGIPFAEPPVGSLRFEAPVPVEAWKGVKDATKTHAVCPQRDIYRRGTLIEGSEDCLYLNVYTPNLPKDGGDPLPVMIFLHGGGWLCGGGNSLWYSPDILLDRDVVLVVTNYRLGALGFLSTGDKYQPGNNGMKDQNLAMRWVKKNAKVFGGDPEAITIFGESAGGVSVQLHMVSPASKGLFNAAISESGTAHCLWGLAPNDQAIRHAKKLAKAFNCNTESSKKLIDCLRDIPAYDLVDKDTIFMKWDSDPMIPFKPVIEPAGSGAFLSQHPIDVLKSGKFNEVPWIVGLNTEDGALRASAVVANPHLMEELDQDFERLAPISLIYDETAQGVLHITQKIRDFYFGDRRINESAKSDIVNMYTDGWFLHGIDEAVRYYLKYSTKPVYYYLFGHRGAASFTEIFGDKERDYGVCHADELQYLFPVGEVLFPDKPPSNTDKKVRNLMTKLWVNFAKTGNPTPYTGDLIQNKWEPVQTEDMEYYFIHTENAEMKRGLLLDRAKFWRQLPVNPKINVIRDEL